MSVLSHLAARNAGRAMGDLLIPRLPPRSMLVRNRLDAPQWHDRAGDWEALAGEAVTRRDAAFLRARAKVERRRQSLREVAA